MATPFPKVPAEVRKMTANYTQAAEIAGGDTLTGSATVTVSPAGSLTAGTATVDSVNSLVTFLLSAGTAGANYLVTCLTSTTGGATIAAQGKVQVTNDILN